MQGYDYLLEMLAAQGYVTVSIDANGLNCRDDYIPQRTQLVLEHLRRRKTFSTTGAPAPLGRTFVGAVDMTRVGIMGHSRGGEAVSAVPEELAATPIPGVKVRSVMAFAPVDVHESRPVNAAYAVIVPLCDGDVWPNSGINMYDRIRNDTQRAYPAAQILLAGGNHNNFNDVWNTDDNTTLGPTQSCSPKLTLGGGAPRAGRAAQRAMAAVAMTDWYAATMLGKPLPAYLRGEAPPSAMSAWAGADLDLRISYSGATHQLLEDFQTAAASTTNSLGLPNDASGYQKLVSCSGADCDTALGVCNGTTCVSSVGRCSAGARSGCGLGYELFHRYNYVQAVAASWSTPNAGLRFALGDFDGTRFEALAMRIAVADSALNAADTQDATVHVTDAKGQTAAVKISEVQRLPRLYRTRLPGDTTSDVRPPKELLQSVRVTKTAVLRANPAFDWKHIAKLDVTMDAEGHASGAVFITDVELSD